MLLTVCGLRFGLDRKKVFLSCECQCWEPLFLSIPTGLPKVRFLCGVTQVIKMEKWIIKGPSGVHLSRQQLPLKLAWAISIHKSQVGVLVQLSVDFYTIINLISWVSFPCWWREGKLNGPFWGGTPEYVSSWESISLACGAVSTTGVSLRALPSAELTLDYKAALFTTVGW